MAGLIPSAVLEQIRNANDIVDIVGSYLPLKRAGANFVALCPFHREKTPSFHVTPHRQIFHCFGCHKGGDVIAFIREYEGISFVEAVKRLAERANIVVEQVKQPGSEQTRHLKESLWQIHEQITQRWHNALLNETAGQMARDYLKNRGVSDAAITLFRIGCAPDQWDDTVNWARNKGYELPLMEQAGLVLRKEGSEKFYDRFRCRLIFPICDEQARVIGFSGRILAGDEKTAKYVNSPETPIFTKGKVFFGLDKSKRALLELEQAIVCEGQLDLIACYMAGVRNVVAPQGTALTEDHARILKRYIQEVILCFDADVAGQNAAVRSLGSLLSAGLAIRVATLPAPHDPDSFIKEHGAGSFQQLIQNAPGFFDYYLERLSSDNDISTDRGRLSVLRGMSEALHKARNEVLTDKYAQKTALRLGVSAQAVRAEFKKSFSSLVREGSSSSVGSIAANEQATISLQEKWLLRILFFHEEHLDWITSNLDLQWVTNQSVRRILSERFLAHENRAWQSLAGFLEGFEADSAIHTLVSEIVAEDLVIREPERQLSDIVLYLRNQFLSNQITALSQRLAETSLSDDQRLQVLQQQQVLRKAKSAPLSPPGGNNGTGQAL